MTLIRCDQCLRDWPQKGMTAPALRSEGWYVEQGRHVCPDRVGERRPL